MWLMMKNKFVKNRAFTMIECIFAILILSIISIYIIFGINTFLRIQNSNINNNEKLSGIENTVALIRNNINNNKYILNKVDINKYDVIISDLGELYNIKIFLKDDMEKVYEFYVSK